MKDALLLERYGFVDDDSRPALPVRRTKVLEGVRCQHAQVSVQRHHRLGGADNKAKRVVAPVQSAKLTGDGATEEVRKDLFGLIYNDEVVADTRPRPVAADEFRQAVKADGEIIHPSLPLLSVEGKVKWQS